MNTKQKIFVLVPLGIVAVVFLANHPINSAGPALDNELACSLPGNQQAVVKMLEEVVNQNTGLVNLFTGGKFKDNKISLSNITTLEQNPRAVECTAQVAVSNASEGVWREGHTNYRVYYTDEGKVLVTLHDMSQE